MPLAAAEMQQNDDSEITAYCVVMTTTATDAEAKTLARLLVEQQLAACVQRQSVNSTYVWEGRICDESETLLLIKTEYSQYEAVAAFIHAHHSYTVPEILCLPVQAGSTPYLAWVTESLRKKHG
jgi:periplasmic divalent cation tolerance protein